MFSLAADIQKRNGRRTSKERFGRKGVRRNEPLNEEKRTGQELVERSGCAGKPGGRGGRVCTDEDREKTRINTERDRE